MSEPPSPNRFHYESLQRRLAHVLEEHASVEQSYCSALDPSMRIRLKRRMDRLMQDIQQLNTELYDIKQPVEQGAYASSAALETPVDIVVITALDDERLAMLACLPNYQQLPQSVGDIHVCYQAGVAVTNPAGLAASYQVVVCQLPGMGRVRAAITTRDLLQRFRHRYVLLVGIAGGHALRGVSCGDVLVATQIVDYELQKLAADAPQIRWEVHRTAERLCNLARHLPNTWQQSCNDWRPAPGVPQAHFGPVASGDKVIAIGHIMQQLSSYWPLLIGIEMEAAGVAAAAIATDPPTPFFMIRGVSDLADNEKDDRWRPYACAIAAAYTRALLESGPIPASSHAHA